MNNEVNKPFLEHLDELRSRVIKSFLSIILFSVIGYFISDKIIELLILPINFTLLIILNLLVNYIY